MPGTLIDTNTVWLLFSGESRTSPDYLRFMIDILRAFDNLVAAGVKPGSILCFFDFEPSPGPAVAGANKSFDQVLADLGGQVRQATSFYKELGQISASAIAFASTGHGDYRGIAGVCPLTPRALISALRGVKTVETVVVVVTQCFAGIFDYLDVMGAPDTVILGSTKLHPSISLAMGGLTYDANIFWTFFFDWIQQPNDVDGDGQLSMADAYKSAALKTNYHLTQLKVKLSMNFEGWCLSEMNAIANITDPVKQADKENNVRRQAEIYHTHQEPWMLNSAASRKILVK